MKLEHTYQNIITELQGISPQARAWTPILTNFLVDDDPPNPLIIDGEKYPDAYENFPVDKFVIHISDNAGGYDDRQSGYDENKKYVVHLSVPIFHHKRKLSIELTLNHELRHAFEDYNRISNNRTRLSQTKEAELFYNPDFERLLTGKTKEYISPFREIMTALYYTSKIEESGYAETVADIPNFSIIGILKDILKRNYVNAKQLSKDRFVQKRWEYFKANYKIPILDKFNDYSDFINWADSVIQRRAKKMYKKLLKTQYIHHMKKGGI